MENPWEKNTIHMKKEINPTFSDVMCKAQLKIIWSQARMVELKEM